MTKKLIMILGLVLSSMLMKAQAFFVPFPKAGDKYWQKQVPVAMRNNYIRLGNLYQKKPWNAIPAETFAEFRTNGNRTRYEEASFGIRKQFVCLVMAEIMQGRGRFLPSIRKGWKNNANNWNTWITANWLQTVLICEQDAKQRDAAFKGVQQCLRTFMKGYPDDGGCEEGVSYWDCAGASFFESLYFMQFAPKQAVLTLTDAPLHVAEVSGYSCCGAKDGNNAESHNHNDIGNFIVYHNNQPVVIDLGRDTYTSKSFSNQRFELMNCRSAYHNVPIINGLEQKDGRKYRADKVSHGFADGVSSLTLNLEKAYTEGAHVEKWQRNITLDREYNWVEITEQYKLDSLQIEKDRLNGQVFDNQIILMAYGRPVVQKAGRILLQGGMVRLEYDAQYLSASVEKVQMTDGIMKTQWKDNIYRIILRLNDNYPMAKVKYRFTLSYCANRHNS